jgi:hypothetical protein
VNAIHALSQLSYGPGSASKRWKPETRLSGPWPSPGRLRLFT